MAKLSNDKLNQLLMQAKFAPEEKRLQQIEACHALIRLINPKTACPYEFVCFHLTGYHPKEQQNIDATATVSQLIPYETLIADLSAYAAQLSKTLDINVTSCENKIYTIDRLAKRFRVTQKTISRWRKTGLIGQFMIFPDGRRRLAFTDYAVDFFISQNRKKIKNGAAFSQIDDDQKQAILKRLARWSHFCPDHRQEAIRRTARRFNRSIETIRLLLTKAESDSNEAGEPSLDIAGPSSIRFLKRADDMTPALCRQITTAYEDGATVEQLIKQFSRSRSNIYRAVNLTWAKQLQLLDIHYIPNDRFENKQNTREILTPPPGLFGDPRHPTLESVNQIQSFDDFEISLKDTPPLESIDAYFSQIADNPILNQRQEQFLFCKYNYLKFSAVKMIARLDPDQPSGLAIRKIRNLHSQAEHLKNQIIQANLRLVVSVARKHTRHTAEMLDLISEGNVILMNAVEKFDFSRGFKFSTYASWALAKRFASFHTAIANRKQFAPGDEILEVTADLRIPATKIVALESARMSLHQIMAETLEDREKRIVKAHFGLADEPDIPIKRKPKSLTQIGKLLGLSKERVRQIELKALQKLRRLLSPEQFELLINA